MKVRVRLVAMENLRPPPFDPDGEAVLDMPDGASLADGLSRLPVQGLGSVIALLNDSPVPEGEREKTLLSEDDMIIIFPPLEGG